VGTDDSTGRCHWTADNVFKDTGRRVFNEIQARFRFRDGLVVDHLDECNAKQWAKKTYGFPMSVVVGSCEPLRRWAATRSLAKV
jgi:hypothetical protein